MRESLWYSVCVLLALCGLLVAGPAYVNHDAAWYLHMVEIWFAGGALYRDVIDTNPPLIVLLTAPPVALARALSASPVAVFKAYVFLLAAGSAICSMAIARRQVEWKDGGTPGPIAAAIVFVLLPFARGDFGQREHLAVILALPYALAAVCFARGGALPVTASVPVGFAGGLGFAIKPHFVVAWLALEICLVLLDRRAWRRTEAVVAAGVFVLYGAAVLLLFPAYLEIARIVVEVYGGLNSSSAVLWRLPDLQVWLVAAALLAFLRLPRSEWRACAVLFALATGFWIAAALQLKGWSYHLYPARAFAIVFFAVLADGVVRALPDARRVLRGGRASVTAAILVVVFGASARYVVEARRPVAQDLVTPLASAVRQHAPRGPIAVLSMRTIIYPAFPVVNYTGATWSLRHNSLWFLPGLYERELGQPSPSVAFRSTAAMSAVERDLFEQVVSDLCARPPGLLAVEAANPRAPAGRRALDLLAYYRQDARFARLESAYTQSGTLDPFILYTPSKVPSCE